jgi:hypothetical protein
MTTAAAPSRNSATMSVSAVTTPAARGLAVRNRTFVGHLSQRECGSTSRSRTLATMAVA